MVSVSELVPDDAAEIKRAEAKRDEARRRFDATKLGDPERPELGRSPHRRLGRADRPRPDAG